MISAVIWKHSFCALKSLKIGFIGVPSNIPFSLIKLCGQPILIFCKCQWD